MKQSEAVFQVVSAVFETELSEGGVAIPDTKSWSEAQKQQVYQGIFSMFKSGQTSHSKSPDDAALLKYIPGLVNNHVRKDSRLNGGTKYTPKNPGTRSGSGDESVKAMRALLSVTTDSEARTQIEAAIKARLAELKPTVKINVDALPESLRHLA